MGSGIDYQILPVYAQKQKILDSLSQNQVIVVQSPTGSGKTTQIPVILHEAGYSRGGVIAVTQPRRIAALSVSEFISGQLGTTYPGLVGYKMRFEDKTDATTRIKIMTDGILLQEMKMDPWLSKYSVVMVDEAHERSLNIDFVLGLLKRVLSERKDFKVIVSSATMNAEAFSEYFGGCPVVSIETQTYPVTLVYDPPEIPASTATLAAEDALLAKIESTIQRILDREEEGDILVFLPGEKVIKDCMKRLGFSRFRSKIHLVPLYGRLAKEEQEKVFDPAPAGRKKVVVSTNIAETSVTISGITSVIDSGLAKLNFYNPRTFTSSLDEAAVSKASCNQRRGRAGRTCPGTCYRLYPRKDFESREEYTLEEIYRTDLSEVVLRMSELGITDFGDFDFISPPGREGMIGAVDTLNLLKALAPDNTLSQIGRMMVEFPLMPRVSRIIVESVLRHPSVLDEALIAASFLSAQSPFVLPQGEEADARAAHQEFRDMYGDFVSYVKMFRRYSASTNKERFCQSNYLDERVMAEIANIREQLGQIVGERLGVPISEGGPAEEFLCCVASGMIQFVCARRSRESYCSLTADRIKIHPGSSMFHANPQFIVAGEIVRTSRMFAMSVSPLTKSLLAQIDPSIEERLEGEAKKGQARKEERQERQQKADAENKVLMGAREFELRKVKGKRVLRTDFASFAEAAKEAFPEGRDGNEAMRKFASRYGNVRCALSLGGGSEVLGPERMEAALRYAMCLNPVPLEEGGFDRGANFNAGDAERLAALCRALPLVMRLAPVKPRQKSLGFVSLRTDGNGGFWLKPARKALTAAEETLGSLEALISQAGTSLSDEQKEAVSAAYRAAGGVLG